MVAVTTRRLVQLLPSAVIDVSTEPTAKEFGVIYPGESYATGLTWGTITNTGGIPIDIYICATDMVGGGYTWVLANDAVPGYNVYGLKAGLEGGSYSIIIKREGSTPYNILVSGLGPGNTQRWGFTLYAPTSWTEHGNIMSGTITLLAEAA